MNSEAPLGELLIGHARGARHRALLCAPFVKVAVVERLLSVLDPGVEIELFTRWRPEEVAAGVSDTDVLGLIRERGGAVSLCDPLHAKLFLFDELALIGSANLTAKALGWSPQPNLELLVEVAADLPAVAAATTRLRASAIEATEEIAAEVEQAAALLPRPALAGGRAEAGAEQPSGESGEPWLPRLREPRDLYTAYAKGFDRLSRTSAEAAAADLAALQVPPVLGREAFERLVGTRLLQAPSVREIDRLLDRSRRFGELRDVLADALGLDREEAAYAWQTLMRWLLYFLPGRYSRSIPSHSEIMVRKETRL